MEGLRGDDFLGEEFLELSEQILVFVFDLLEDGVQLLLIASIGVEELFILELKLGDPLLE